MVLQLSFEKAHYLVITENDIYKADDITDDIAEGISEGVFRVVQLEDLTQVTTEGSNELLNFEEYTSDDHT